MTATTPIVREQTRGELVIARPLVSALSHDSPLSPDERSVLVLLADGVDAGPAKTARVVPHGLSGVLVWAVRAARVALADDALSLPRPGYCEPVACPGRRMRFRQWICN